MSRSASLAMFRVLLLVGVGFFIVITQAAGRFLRYKASQKLLLFWHRLCRRIIGMKIEVGGSPPVSGAALFVSNHISYLDVTAIGSVVEGAFVARADLQDWPIFGFLSRLQRTIFIKRCPRYARQQMLELSGRLCAGDRLILFPEGTSSDGNTILPFKSTLFAVAAAQFEARAIPVQPISIAYTRLDGFPLGRLLRPIYAWYGDMPFAPHFWHLLGYGRFQVDIIIHDPIRLEDFESRKALAGYCEQKVTRGFSEALAGRSAITAQTKNKLPLSSVA